MWKWLFGIVVVLCLTAAGGTYYLVSSGTLREVMKSFRPDMKGTTVRFEPVTRGNLVRTISAPGVIEPRTKVEISAQVAARIVALPFREGQRVKKGDVVVRLDADDLAAALESAEAGLKREEAQLEGARASLANATAELGRRRELFASKDISKAELDQSEAEYLRAESNFRASMAAIEIAKAQITRAKKDLDNSTIASPMDGIITRLEAEVGELVVVGTLNNPGSVIMEIADLSDLLVRAKIDEANIAPVKPGQTAKVFLNAKPETPFTATVERVKLVRQIDRDNTAYFEAELKLDADEEDALYSGMTCNVDVAVETLYDVLLVPSQAILDRKTDELPKATLDQSAAVVDPLKKFARVVYVMENGKAAARPVSVGASDLTRTVLLGGINEGDKVVVGPFKALIVLKDGQALTDEATEPAKTGSNTPATAAEQKRDALPEPRQDGAKPGDPNAAAGGKG